ncbi:hypothetical protein DYB26_013067 [Aphanomyces astaci]|uniref:Uncharacterized protein n=1 Tax=Aphanomyces astaci TaxID=112090 RepID=A0A418CMY7_APHAT|nr:hypothetical protein DYB26_013067 [Aphanomyces astaci]
MYSLGRKARTIACAKTAMVAFFKERLVEPNPAQATETKRYFVGLQKFNRQNNVDDEKKAHPLSAHELSLLMNSFGDLNPFVGTMSLFVLHVLSGMLSYQRGPCSALVRLGTSSVGGWRPCVSAFTVAQEGQR